MIATALPAKSGASWRVESGVSLATMDLGYIYIVVYKLLMRCHIDYIYYICSIHIHIYTR
jgi:hypothetical protein